MSDDSFHEIQLEGKQLIFLAMSATVAAVVIFLCGVMVGRGLSSTGLTGTTELASEEEVDPTSPIPLPVTTAVDVASSGVSASAEEDLTYARRLEAPEPLSEPALEPLAAPPARRPPVERTQQAREERDEKVEKPAPPPAARPARPASTEPAATAVAGDSGFVVQVAAVSSREEAEAMAKRLSAKGFPTFVTTPESGAARVYRVRVGRYSDRRAAEVVARRLEQEEQFKPWITR